MSENNTAEKYWDNVGAIPNIDDDDQVVIEDSPISNGRSVESIPSTYGSESPTRDELGNDEHEEKARLISQVLELQNTLDDLHQRVDSVKEENLKLRSENQVLAQYIENLMSASSVFQSTNNPNTIKKK
jgi:hypothetical protein